MCGRGPPSPGFLASVDSQDYSLDKSKQQAHRFRQRQPKMTIALAFNCVDGIVILADSLETDGVTKILADKIWAYQIDQEWGITIASAGEADLADSFTDSIDGVLGTDVRFDENKILLTLRSAIAQTRRTYPDSDLAMLVGIFGPPFFRKVYRVTEDSNHLGPIRRYEALGIGSSLAKFLCSQMFSDFVLVDEAIRLGIFIISIVSEHVDGCGGPISLIASKKNEKGWLYEHPDKVASIQKEFDFKDFRKNLVDFWLSKNDSVQKLEHDRYKGISVGGFPRTHTKVSGSKEPPKQSVSQKSKQKP